jgi:hypothetical protein
VKNSLRLRFWLEAGMGAVTGVFFVVTLLWRDWIEVIFNVDPDRGNGLLEWSIAGGFLVATIILCFLARYEWRRIQPAHA